MGAQAQARVRARAQEAQAKAPATATTSPALGGGQSPGAARQWKVSLSNTKGYSSTYLAMGFANVRAGTQKRHALARVIRGYILTETLSWPALVLVQVHIATPLLSKAFEMLAADPVPPSPYAFS